MAELMRTYDGMGLYAARTDADKAGNDLTLGIEGTIDYLEDEDLETILDEQGNPMLSDQSTAIINTIGGIGLRAEQSDADGAGNVIADTYATKSELNSLISDLETTLAMLNDRIEAMSRARDMYDLGTKTEADLDEGTLVISTGNSTTALTLTTVSAVTICANPGVPNFAVTIDNSGNSGDVTVTVKDNTGTTTLLTSSDAGNKVEAGAISQLTCVSNCWTLADFEA